MCMRCPSCGSEIKDENASFCPFCARSLKNMGVPVREMPVEKISVRPPEEAVPVLKGVPPTAGPLSSQGPGPAGAASSLASKGRPDPVLPPVSREAEPEQGNAPAAPAPVPPVPVSAPPMFPAVPQAPSRPAPSLAQQAPEFRSPYDQDPVSQPKNKSLNPAVMMGLIILFLLVVAFGAFYLFLIPPKKDTPPVLTVSQLVDLLPEEPKNVLTMDSVTEYGLMGVTLSLPKDWKIKAKTKDRLHVSSPEGGKSCFLKYYETGTEDPVSWETRGSVVENRLSGLNDYELLESGDGSIDGKYALRCRYRYADEESSAQRFGLEYCFSYGAGYMVAAMELEGPELDQGTLTFFEQIAATVSYDPEQGASLVPVPPPGERSGADAERPWQEEFLGVSFTVPEGWVIYDREADHLMLCTEDLDDSIIYIEYVDLGEPIGEDLLRSVDDAFAEAWDVEIENYTELLIDEKPAMRYEYWGQEDDIDACSYNFTYGDGFIGITLKAFGGLPETDLLDLDQLIGTVKYSLETFPGDPKIGEEEWLWEGRYVVGEDLEPGVYYLESPDPWEEDYENAFPCKYTLFQSSDAEELGELLSGDEPGDLFFTFLTLEEGQVLCVDYGRLIPADERVRQGPHRGLYQPGCYRVGIDIPAGAFYAYPFYKDESGFCSIYNGEGKLLFSNLVADDVPRLMPLQVISGSRLQLRDAGIYCDFN